MIQASFIEELDYALGNMSSTQKEDILSEFTQHFIQAKKEGKTEEEICRNLGDPKAIAAQFFTDGADPDPSYIRQETGNEQNCGNNTSYTDTVIPSDGFIDTQERFDATDITFIDINVKRADIRVNGTDTNSINVSVKGRTVESRFHIKCENKRLTIEEEKLSFGLLSFLKRMNHNVDVTVLLPRGFQAGLAVKNSAGSTNVSRTGGDRLDIKNSAGSIDISECGFDYANIQDTAGSICINACSADNLNVHSTAGEIKISGVTGSIKAHAAAGNIEVKSSTGNITAKSTAGDVKIRDTSGDIDAYTSAGNVHIESPNSSGSIKIKSTAGNVHVDADDITKLEADSSAGSAKVTARRICDGYINTSAGDAKLHTEMITGHVTVKSSMGRAKVVLPMDAQVKIKASSSMGKAIVEIPGDNNANAFLEVYSSMGEASVRAAR